MITFIWNQLLNEFEWIMHHLVKYWVSNSKKKRWLGYHYSPIQLVKNQDFDLVFSKRFEKKHQKGWLEDIFRKFDFELLSVQGQIFETILSSLILWCFFSCWVVILFFETEEVFLYLHVILWEWYYHFEVRAVPVFLCGLMNSSNENYF